MKRLDLLCLLILVGLRLAVPTVSPEDFIGQKNALRLRPSFAVLERNTGQTFLLNEAGLGLWAVRPFLEPLIRKYPDSTENFLLGVFGRGSPSQFKALQGMASTTSALVDLFRKQGVGSASTQMFAAIESQHLDPEDVLQVSGNRTSLRRDLILETAAVIPYLPAPEFTILRLPRHPRFRGFRLPSGEEAILIEDLFTDRNVFWSFTLYTVRHGLPVVFIHASQVTRLDPILDGNGRLIELSALRGWDLMAHEKGSRWLWDPSAGYFVEQVDQGWHLMPVDKVLGDILFVLCPWPLWWLRRRNAANRKPILEARPVRSLTERFVDLMRLGFALLLTLITALPRLRESFFVLAMGTLNPLTYPVMLVLVVVANATCYNLVGLLLDLAMMMAVGQAFWACLREDPAPER